MLLLPPPQAFDGHTPAETCRLLHQYIDAAAEYRILALLATVGPTLRDYAIDAPSPATGRRPLEAALSRDSVEHRHVAVRLLEAGARADLAVLAAEPVPSTFRQKTKPARDLLHAVLVNNEMVCEVASERDLFLLSLCRQDDSSPPGAGIVAVLRNLLASSFSLDYDGMLKTEDTFEIVLQLSRLAVDGWRRPSPAQVLGLLAEEAEKAWLAIGAPAQASPSRHGWLVKSAGHALGHALAYAEELRPGSAAAAAAAAQRQHGLLALSLANGVGVALSVLTERLGLALTGLSWCDDSDAEPTLPAAAAGSRPDNLMCCPERSAGKGRSLVLKRIHTGLAARPAPADRLRWLEGEWAQFVTDPVLRTADSGAAKDERISHRNRADWHWYWSLLAPIACDAARQAAVHCGSRAVTALQAALAHGPIGRAASSGAEGVDAAAAADDPEQLQRRIAKLQYAAVVCVGRWGEDVRAEKSFEAAAQRDVRLIAARAGLERLKAEISGAAASRGGGC